MKDMFSFVVSCISLVFIAMAASAFIIMELTVGNARAFHTNSIDRIQSSLYSPTVIQECINEAEENGYTLKVEDVTIYDERKDVKVTLTYSVPGWLLAEDKEGTLVGYAR